jgi:hypothetical protein
MPEWVYGRFIHPCFQTGRFKFYLIGDDTAETQGKETAQNNSKKIIRWCIVDKQFNYTDMAAKDSARTRIRPKDKPFQRPNVNTASNKGRKKYLATLLSSSRS